MGKGIAEGRRRENGEDSKGRGKGKRRGQRRGRRERKTTQNKDSSRERLQFHRHGRLKKNMN
jgi:hypothetical protein